MKYTDKIIDLLIDYCKKNSNIEIYYDRYYDTDDIKYILYDNVKIKTPCNNVIYKKEKLSHDDVVCKIMDCYSESVNCEIDNYIDNFIDDIKNTNLKNYALNHKQDLYSDLLDIIYDYVDIIYPIDDIMNEYIKINIFYKSKTDSGYDDEWLKVLLHSQGLLIKNHSYLKKLLSNLHIHTKYSDPLNKKDKSQLEYDYKNNTFLKSLIDEINNCYLDSPRDLCFIANVKIKDYYNLLEKNKEFFINKDAVCGLVDYYNGGGSILEIQLLKDIKLNTNNIKVLIEGIDKYTVDDIYGLCGSCFKDCVKITNNL